MDRTVEKKKTLLRAIFEKTSLLPEKELDYAIGFIEGMSTAYDRAMEKENSPAGKPA